MACYRRMLSVSFTLCFFTGVIAKDLHAKHIVFAVDESPILKLRLGDYNFLSVDTLKKGSAFFSFSNLNDGDIVVVSIKSISGLASSIANLAKSEPAVLFEKYLESTFIKRSDEKKQVYYINGIPVYSYISNANKVCRERFIRYLDDNSVLLMGYSGKCINKGRAFKDLMLLNNAEYSNDNSYVLIKTYETPEEECDFIASLESSLAKLGFSQFVSRCKLGKK